LAGCLVLDQDALPMTAPIRSMPACIKCPIKVGPRSTVYCEYHAGYHAGHAKDMMAGKRKYDPAYCDRERSAVKKRMRKLRANPDYQRPDRTPQ
jgi:hypothetical protein